MVRPEDGITAGVRWGDPADPLADLEAYVIAARKPLGSLNSTRGWCSEHKTYSGVHHNNANRKKKAERKQAQASRRKNRR